MIKAAPSIINPPHGDLRKAYSLAFIIEPFQVSEDVHNFTPYLDSLYTGVVPAYDTQLVTLITCAYHVDNGKFAVVLAEKAAG